ncbi:hypothetical protein E2C01_037883 [Portunus trituberculatus]|uniref:Uncharacterized protein n=1 Tax=Portunus trituberculatus TaxID=210409 RepID=A0A5B7FFA9_PORTR|nr:hypothetical protein [Portunus trituberculatus]
MPYTTHLNLELHYSIRHLKSISVKGLGSAEFPRLDIHWYLMGLGAPVSPSAACRVMILVPIGSSSFTMPVREPENTGGVFCTSLTRTTTPTLDICPPSCVVERRGPAKGKKSLLVID